MTKLVPEPLCTGCNPIDLNQIWSSYIRFQVHLRIGGGLEPALTRARLYTIAQKAKTRVAVGDVAGAVRGAMEDAAAQLVGYATPQLVYDPRRAWGLSLFFFGSAGIAFLGVYRCW